MKTFRVALVWAGAMMLGWSGERSPAAPAPEPVAKVVRCYALTSANDFPQRDPQDWRLLGSNDGGKTWTTLDVRQGELFPDRHQRRVFQLENRAAFGCYRLQIDRVRKPAAADCVQLAEIEPLGDSEGDLDPVPNLEDLITARGQNAPWEKAAEAFDGRVETKWLDHASHDPATRASWIQWQYRPAGAVVVTNVGQLLGLRSRAARGYRVHLSGVALGRLPGTNLWAFLDGTGHIELPVGGRGPEFSPGQRGLLTGVSEWRDGRAGIKQAHWDLLGSTAAAGPRRIRMDQPLSPEAEWEWVEIEGRAQFGVRWEEGWAFELEEGEHTVRVHLLRGDPANGMPWVGQRVRVRGMCGGLLNARGKRVAGTLWGTGLEAILAAGPAAGVTNPPQYLRPPSPVPPSGMVLDSIEQIRRLSPEELVRWPRVKVRGVVTELFGAYMQEDKAGVEVWYGNPPLTNIPGFGMCVEVEGRGDWAIGHGPIIRADKVVWLGKGKLPTPERCSLSQLASGKLVHQWVELEAVVRSTDGSHLLLNCEGGQLMATIRSAAAPRVKQLVDATVRVRGVSVAASDSRGRLQGAQLLVPSLDFVEIEEAPGDPFALPTRPIGSLLQVRGPKEFTHRVKVEGVLTFREGRRFFLQDATGAASAIAQEEVILDAPTGGSSWMFWQSPRTNSAPKEDLALQPGDRLQVVGFPELRGYSPVLTEVQVRTLGPGTNLPPVRAKLADIAGGTLDSTLVSLEAACLRQDTLGGRVVLELQSEQQAFQALWPANVGGVPAIAPGSRIRVTGVCQIEPIPYPELGRRVASFKLLVPAPGDVTILERPPWWTLRRALTVAGTLAVVLAVAGAWIGLLRRQVGERTKQLKQEITEHEKTEARLAAETRRVQAEIEERKRIEAEVERGHKRLLITSRQAGMAEVATSVLHNVGNVLNSANVLAATILDHVRQSKIPSVGRLAALLAEHRADLKPYLTDDAQGQRLPAYAGRLAEHLSREQVQLRDKVTLLTENIQHIKQIVAMQQNYAKVSGTLETASLAEIVEDALRLHGGALSRHEIRVVRRFAETPPVTLERHKVLQILFNLLENAKHACEERQAADKQITVSVRPNGPGRVQVAVADNGIGIPAHNLERIFAQDFSTRKDGHGFGLHSSLLAAQDMGAALTAHSDGEGKGATFILEFAAATGAARAGSDPPRAPA